MLKSPMQIPLLSVSKGVSLAVKLYMSAWTFIQGYTRVQLRFFVVVINGKPEVGLKTSLSQA